MRAVTANGVEFSCLEAGPPGGPLALCLHGFPDTAHTWRHLLPELADAGYRAVAPFMRAYAPTDIPADGRYQTGALSEDANRLHEALGGTEEAVLIGHDWGALAAYGAVAHEPERWRKLVTAAVPPPAAAAERFFGYDQLRRSWYTFFFQSPLAELALPLDDYAFIDRLWSDWSPGYDATSDLARVKESIGTPERITAAIGYYRALYDAGRHDPALGEVQAAGLGVPPRPTLYRHGAADGCFGVDAIGDVAGFLAEGSEVAVLEGVGHFLHLEEPAGFNRRVGAFVAG